MSSLREWLATPACDVDVDLWQCPVLWVMDVVDPLVHVKVFAGESTARIILIAGEYVNVGNLELFQRPTLRQRPRAAAADAKPAECWQRPWQLLDWQPRDWLLSLSSSFPTDGIIPSLYIHHGSNDANPKKAPYARRWRRISLQCQKVRHSSAISPYARSHDGDGFLSEMATDLCSLLFVGFNLQLQSSTHR